MELEERKIITRAVKKKKEKVEKTKSQEQVRVEIKERAVEVTKVTVPLMKQGDRLNLKNFDTQRPEIQKVKEEKIKPINLPSVKLSLKNLEVKKADTKLEDKSESFQPVLLPSVKLALKNLNTDHSVSTSGKSSDTIRVPKLQRQTPQVKPITQDKHQQVIKIETKAHGELTRKLESKPIDVRVVDIQATETAEEEKYKAKEEEITDFIEILFGEDEIKILSGKPCCIILEKHPEEYEKLIAMICKEIYALKKGGNPEPIFRDTIEDLKLELEPRVSHQVVVVRNAEYSNRLRDILEEFFMRDLGFLILVSKDPLRLYHDIVKDIPSAEEYMIRIESERLSIFRDTKVRERILELVCGLKSIDRTNIRELLIERRISFGELFRKAVEQFERTLLGYLKSTKVPRELRKEWDKLFIKSPESQEFASETHSAMKSFVWIYLWRKYNKKPILEDPYKKVDIVIDNENYEIETLYGRYNPRAQLNEKIRKFSKSKNEKVFFVLRNISILMYLRELIDFKRIWKEEGYDVNIVGINFEKNELIPIEEFAKEVIKWKRLKK